MRTIVSVAAALLLAASLGSSALALQASPMVSDVPPSGPKASYRLSVKNTESVPITIEMQAFRMSVDDNGKRTLTEETNDLTIFPLQSVIPPGREQLIQVRYIGDPKLTAPRMYVVRAAQLPIQTKAASSSADVSASVMVAFNINTHLFVSPVGSKPDIEVQSAKPAGDGGLLVSIHNKGTGIAALRAAKYVVSSGGRQVEIAPEDVDLGDVSALPPGAVRLAKVPAKALQGLSGEMTATVQLQ